MIFNKFLKYNSDVVFLTPTHQSPTGVIMPSSAREKFLSWVNSVNRYIIEDDYDSEFKYKGRVLLLIRAMNEQERAVCMGNFSKSIDQSFKISFMCLPDYLLKRFDALRYTTRPVYLLFRKLLENL